MMDAQEQARVRHASDGFCRVIGCPECEVRRQERFGGKVLDKVRVEVVEGSEQDFKLARLEAENAGLVETVANLRQMVAESAETIGDYVVLATEANERAQALGTEVCGFVGAYAELAEADTGSPEFQEFASVLITMALVKLHDASHRLAPVQPS